eukprot:2791696-Lingulodinium_polyedra.AAC.1
MSPLRLLVEGGDGLNLVPDQTGEARALRDEVGAALARLQMRRPRWADHPTVVRDAVILLEFAGS